MNSDHETDRRKDLGSSGHWIDRQTNQHPQAHKNDGILDIRTDPSSRRNYGHGIDGQTNQHLQVHKNDRISDTDTQTDQKHQAVFDMDKATDDKTTKLSEEKEYSYDDLESSFLQSKYLFEKKKKKKTRSIRRTQTPPRL